MLAFIMFKAALRLLRRSLLLSISYMGTTALAVGAGLVVFALVVVIRWRREGWLAVKGDWIGPAGYGLLLTVIIWLALFGYCVAKLIFDDRVRLTKAINQPIV